MASGKYSSDPSKKTPVDYKAKLEKKLYLARENPEPTFDLSECNLKNVPSNIFSLCRVFRKEALYLQNNQLSDISNGGSLKELVNLKILNISFNKFKKLPCDINALINLEILDVSNNQLQELPDVIGSLQNLKYLNASHNNLESLPYSIGNCQNLRGLYLMGNKPLKKLPNSLGKLNHLEELEFDPTILHPPKEVCQNGVQNVLSFFQQELFDDLETPSTSHNVDKIKAVIEERGVSKKEKKTTSEKKLESLTQEQKLMNEQKRDGALKMESKDVKSKLLADIRNEQIALDERLAKLQEEKNNERALLIKLCQKEEENSNEAVSKILCQNKKLQKHILDEDNKIWKEEEKKLMTSKRFSELNNPSIKLQILASMDETIREEVKKFEANSEKKNLCTIKSLAAEIIFNDDRLQKVVKKTDESKKQLVNDILADEELQKSAVFSLLEKSDATSWELGKQISIVENQLAELTRLELSKQKLANDHRLAELNRNQLALTEVLMNLLDEQRERRKQLIERIHVMEATREENRDANNFWLHQYDLLLRSKSNEIVKILEALNPRLVHELYMNGVFQYLPLLKDVALNEEKLENLNSNALKKKNRKNQFGSFLPPKMPAAGKAGETSGKDVFVSSTRRYNPKSEYKSVSEFKIIVSHFVSKLGIKSSNDRENILNAVQTFLNSERARRRIPSAPESEEPSAPLINNNNSEFYNNPSIKYLVPDECVICLDSKPNVIFLPCGHICCCYKCFREITLCPMCRKPIDEARGTVAS